MPLSALEALGGLTHDKYKVRNWKVGFLCSFSIAVQECPSMTNKVLHTGNGISLFQLMFLGSIQDSRRAQLISQMAKEELLELAHMIKE